MIKILPHLPLRSNYLPRLSGLVNIRSFSTAEILGSHSYDPSAVFRFQCPGDPSFDSIFLIASLCTSKSAVRDGREPVSNGNTSSRSILFGQFRLETL